MCVCVCACVCVCVHACVCYVAVYVHSVLKLTRTGSTLHAIYKATVPLLMSITKGILTAWSNIPMHDP